MHRAYDIIYHPEVKATDLPKLDNKNRKMVRKAIKERLMTEPEMYGQKLQRTLKDYWKLRVGQYRIVFKVAENRIKIFGIIHRKDVYQRLEGRLE
ncbi:MAG: type II toxin-antitoxin system RelE/ParE family toxin [Desulfoferrobacter sp.]